jgi:signal recognition particle receptor subunit beta
MQDCPVLVFANKMDISNFRPVEIVQKMGLYNSKRTWHVQPCCGLNGDGIIEGFEWLRN